MIFSLISLIIAVLIWNILDYLAPDTFVNIPYKWALAFKPTAPVNQSLPDTSAITNQPPEAKVGQDKTVNENTPVILVGDALDSNPNDKISYSWVQTSGHPVTLNGSNTTNPTFITPSVSSTTKLMFSLVVTDDKGAVSKPAIVTIIVRPVNDPPIADAGEDKTVDAGNVVSLDGTWKQRS